MTYEFYNAFMHGRENTRLVTPPEFSKEFPDAVAFEDLPSRDGKGVLKAAYRDGKGVLRQIYSAAGLDNHACVVAATRQGKTTSFVIPSIISCAEQKNQKSLVITDPKGEVYEHTASKLRANGYTVKLLNFRDFYHTEFWNPMTPIFRKYKEYMETRQDVSPVKDENGEWALQYKGKIYRDMEELNLVLDNDTDVLYSEMENLIDELANQMITVECLDDPTWELGSRDLLKAVIYGMLEDTADKRNPMTEEKFNLDALVSICLSFSPSESDPDKGYFQNREEDSKAYNLAKQILLEPGDKTRSSYVSVFITKINEYRENVVRTMTRANTIEFSMFTESPDPVALFIVFRDEVKMQSRTIALFVQRLYTWLINEADRHENNRLPRGVLFMLDEFGNMPHLTDFEKVITTCGARNIWFSIVLQSYAQLKNVYGDASEIIMDNMNVHIFMGSNNLDTLKQFSDECGKYTRVSGSCITQGTDSAIHDAFFETIPVMPVSTLSSLSQGDCVITEINSGYVMFSRLEPYYLCDEYACEVSSLSDYISQVSPVDRKYKYTLTPSCRRRRRFMEDEDY
ncbi:MAG: type IV secretory system conjugative DNA transfer family protein [Clostridia bacterium]|nr:type IV secretory system conjugative DNA transfer family protein [Clostridia bacterium]